MGVLNLLDGNLLGALVDDRSHNYLTSSIRLGLLGADLAEGIAESEILRAVSEGGNAQLGMATTRIPA